MLWNKEIKRFQIAPLAIIEQQLGIEAKRRVQCKVRCSNWMVPTQKADTIEKVIKKVISPVAVHVRSGSAQKCVFRSAW